MTSHPAAVLEGLVANICVGQPIAYMDHKVQCPHCIGALPIVES